MKVNPPSPGARLRDQIREYHAKLYQFREDNAAQALHKLLDLMITNGDLERRGCPPERLAALQGETVAFSLVLKWLTQPPVEIPTQPKGE
jgi:hypothetical protein